MIPLHFIQGLQTSAAGFSALAAQILAYYQQKIAADIQIFFYHYDGDPTAPTPTVSVHDAMQANQPTGPLVLCGWSYGGGQAVLTAEQFAADNPPRRVDHLILLDPVPVGQGVVIAQAAPPAVVGGPGSTAEFALPGNVGECVCFPREATESPYSTDVVSGPNFKNIIEPGDPNTTGAKSGASANHGYSIWNGVCLSFIAVAVNGGNFLAVSTPTPAPAPPPPTPPPTQAAASPLITLTAGYADGSIKVFKPTN